MPSAPRLTLVLVVAALMGACIALPAGALAQSAGDEQYQDPLAGSTSTSAPATTPSSSTTPSVDQIPQLSPTVSNPAPATTTPAPTAAHPAALPNTGIDGRILAGAGLGLLLCGLGLRLRTARERL